VPRRHLLERREDVVNHPIGCEQQAVEQPEHLAAELFRPPDGAVAQTSTALDFDAWTTSSAVTSRPSLSDRYIPSLMSMV